MASAANILNILISFLTLGLYLPRAFTITGFTSGQMLPEDLDMDTVAPTKK